MAELPLYDSFEEQTEEACLMCAQNSDDAMKFGEKMSDDKITAHFFCMVSGDLSTHFSFIIQFNRCRF